jgi:predicted amidophosphoribosyltransferase
MVETNPMPISGPWTAGFVLDSHVLGSEPDGFNKDGRIQYTASRSPLGELLYRLKYRHDRSVLDELTGTIHFFLKEQWGIADIVDCIVPVPPSNEDRLMQPVYEIASGLAEKLGISCYDTCLVKSRKTDESKHTKKRKKKIDMLAGSMTIKGNELDGRTVLLLDDLYGTGATLLAATQVMICDGHVLDVYVTALTKTKG